MPRTTSRRLLVSVLLACLAFALPSSASAGEICADANVVPTAATGAQVRAATLCLINEQRVSHGVHALRPNGQLRRAATSYSRQMVRGRFFAHVCPAGSTPRSRVGSASTYLAHAKKWSVGENLYWGSDRLATPQQTVRAWMRSAPHRRTMLGARYNDVGIGVAIGAPENVQGAPSATYTAEFGSRGSR